MGCQNRSGIGERIEQEMKRHIRHLGVLPKQRDKEVDVHGAAEWDFASRATPWTAPRGQYNLAGGAPRQFGRDVHQDLVLFSSAGVSLLRDESPPPEFDGILKCSFEVKDLVDL